MNTNNHPCINCITFVMCQSRLQASIKNRLLNNPYDYDYSDYDSSSHRELVALSFYMELAHCDMLTDYIEEVQKQSGPPNKNYYIERESVMLDALYEAFKIELTQIIDFQELIKDNKRGKN